MKSIYFEDKVITFTGDIAVLEPGTGELLRPEDLEITKVLQKFGNHNNLWVVSSDYEVLFERFCTLFHRAEAAGGLVSNTKDEVLMIFRNGRWDLPKGHREEGESWEDCALREVEEECGIKAGTKGFLTVTFHTYLLNGVWTLKECRWYAMYYQGAQKPVPQQDEGIECVEWIAVSDMQQTLKDSYQTIKEVVNAATQKSIKT